MSRKIDSGTSASHSAGQGPDARAMRNVIVPRLQSDVPEIAAIYVAGVAIVDGGPCEAHKYLLGHTMREIRTRLPLHYGVATTERFAYPAAVSRFLDDWITEIRSVLRTPQKASGTPDRIQVPRRLAMDIDALVYGHEQVGENVRDLYVRLNERVNPTSFPTTSTGGVIDQWLNLPLDGMAHVPGPEHRAYTLAQTLAAWGVMERYLYYIFAAAHVTYRELDHILEEANAS